MRHSVRNKHCVCGVTSSVDAQKCEWENSKKQFCCKCQSNFVQMKINLKILWRYSSPNLVIPFLKVVKILIFSKLKEPNSVIYNFNGVGSNFENFWFWLKYVYILVTVLCCQLLTFSWPNWEFWASNIYLTWVVSYEFFGELTIWILKLVRNTTHLNQNIISITFKILFEVIWGTLSDTDLISRKKLQIWKSWYLTKKLSKFEFRGGYLGILKSQKRV